MNNPSFKFIQPNVREIEMIKKTCLTEDGLPMVLPMEKLLIYSYESLLVVMQQHAFYVWPTSELVYYLDQMYPDKSTVIEIGSGNGVLAQELGIRATDNYSQSYSFRPKNEVEAKTHFEAMQVFEVCKIPTVRYGKNVEQLDAIDAIKKYKPKHVIGCYVTHKYKPVMLDGNELGVDEDFVLANVNTYMVVGNQGVHRNKPILEKPHNVITLSGLLMRSNNPDKNCIYYWGESSN